MERLANVTTATGLVGIVMVAISLACALVPGLRERWDALTNARKASYQAMLTLAMAVLAVADSCTVQWVAPLVCERAVLVDYAVLVVVPTVLGFGMQQAVYNGAIKHWKRAAIGEPTT